MYGCSGEQVMIVKEEWMMRRLGAGYVVTMMLTQCGEELERGRCENLRRLSVWKRHLTTNTASRTPHLLLVTFGRVVLQCL